MIRGRLVNIAVRLFLRQMQSLYISRLTSCEQSVYAANTFIAAKSFLSAGEAQVWLRRHVEGRYPAHGDKF